MKKFEITGVTVAKELENEYQPLNSSTKVHNFLRSVWPKDICAVERFYIVLLNNKLDVNGFVELSKGDETATIVSVKQIILFASQTLSTHVVLAHNHPTGTMVPSSADKNITKKIKEALKYIDTQVMDHIILSGTEHTYYSMRDNGDI